MADRGVILSVAHLPARRELPSRQRQRKHLLYRDILRAAMAVRRRRWFGPLGRSCNWLPPPRSSQNDGEEKLCVCVEKLIRCLHIFRYAGRPGFPAALGVSFPVFFSLSSQLCSRVGQDPVYLYKYLFLSALSLFCAAATPGLISPLLSPLLPCPSPSGLGYLQLPVTHYVAEAAVLPDTLL